MPNLNVLYQRGNYALQTLVAEISARWGKPSRPYEFVTGYRAADNFTGHNADNNGVAHGVDIFVGPGNLSPSNADVLTSFLRSEGLKGDIPGHPDRLYYIIHQDRIAGDFSNWEWVGAGYGHWDHIHVSTCDLFWGDVAPVHPLDYDSTAAWGLSKVTAAKPQSGTITPIPEKEGLFMTLTPQQEKDIYWELCSESGRADRAKRVANEILNRPIASAGAMKGRSTSLGLMVAWNDDHVIQTLAAVAAAAASDGATVEQIQAAVKTAIAESVVTVAVTVEGGQQ